MTQKSIVEKRLEKKVAQRAKKKRPTMKVSGSRTKQLPALLARRKNHTAK